MCSGRVDPQFVLKALHDGADGVMIAGCHPGECHYVEGNFKALRRFKLLKRVLTQFGIEDERVQLVWASASEGIMLAAAVDRMTEELRSLGPSNWAARQGELTFSGNGQMMGDKQEQEQEKMEVPA